MAAGQSFFQCGQLEREHMGREGGDLRILLRDGACHNQATKQENDIEFFGN